MQERVGKVLERLTEDEVTRPQLIFDLLHVLPTLKESRQRDQLARQI